MTISWTPSFCSVCGGSVSRRFVVEEERERHVCESCGHIHYLNPVIVAGAIPVSGDGVWLLRRAIEPRLGFWTFPAGYMELGETVEQAAIRETREELNMEVRLERLLNVYSRADLRTVHVIYVAAALESGSNGAEALECRLFRADEIPWEQLAFSSTRDALTDWLAEGDGRNGAAPPPISR